MAETLFFPPFPQGQGGGLALCDQWPVYQISVHPCDLPNPSPPVNPISVTMEGQGQEALQRAQGAVRGRKQ